MVFFILLFIMRGSFYLLALDSQDLNIAPTIVALGVVGFMSASNFFSDRRLADHFGGKLHLGYMQIREKLVDLRVSFSFLKAYLVGA